MAVSVIDTRGEFKIVPCSGDDEHWPQWVLQFEAWSELARLVTTTGCRSSVHSANRQHDA